MTRKQLPSLALGNYFWEMNAGELPEVIATAGGFGDCWKLRQVAGDAPMMIDTIS